MNRKLVRGRRAIMAGILGLGLLAGASACTPSPCDNVHRSGNCAAHWN